MSDAETGDYDKEKRSIDDSEAVVEEDGEKRLKMESLSKSGGSIESDSEDDE